MILKLKVILKLLFRYRLHLIIFLGYSYYTYEYPEHFKILPVINNWFASPSRIKNGSKVPEGFTYRSDNNSEWMTDKQLLSWIKKNHAYIGNI